MPDLDDNLLQVGIIGRVVMVHLGAKSLMDTKKLGSEPRIVWLSEGWMVGWLDGWMVGWLDGWMVGWLVGWLVVEMV